MSYELIDQAEIVELKEHIKELHRLIKGIIPHKEDQLLDAKQVCKILHISLRTLQRYRDAGRIKYYKVNRLTLYKRSEIEEFIDSNGK